MLIINTSHNWSCLLCVFPPSLFHHSILLSYPSSFLCPPLCRPVDINAQARKLQRNRAKGTLTLPRSSNSSFSRSLSETSLNQVRIGRTLTSYLLRKPSQFKRSCLQLGVGDEPKRFYSTLPGPVRGRERETSTAFRKEEGGQNGGGVKHSLYQSPHLLLLQGYNRQVKRPPRCCFRSRDGVWRCDAGCAVCRTAWCTC